ncbi:ABC transporter ATP-binding protein [Microtetraspora niveoalba]|uniref:ABC transporter ATP-binding protein n=1 Tax=Microtetraspora niveoalba TaxID=46175 RepID=UPI00083310CE|nr:ABC transporter ATP-binding protein [Microtetraspora niveoalba]
MNVLDVRDLSVEIPTETGHVLAVDGLSYSVGESEILAIVGESGCGKSVGVLSLLGLGPEHARVTGEVNYAGQNLLTRKPDALRRVRGQDIAYIFQDPMTALNPLMPVGKQVEEVLAQHASMSRAERRARVVELFELVGIPAAAERARAYPHQLSGGMRQRVMISMAIACGPRVLIADEPTTALDVTVQAAILEILKDLRDKLGMAIVLITHDMGVVADIADRVVVMYAGRAIEEGGIEQVFRRPAHPYTRGLLSAVPVPGQRAARARLRGIPGTVPVIAESVDACTFADRCGRADEACRSGRPPLAEAAGGTRVACRHPETKESNGE